MKICKKIKTWFNEKIYSKKVEALLVKLRKEELITGFMITEYFITINIKGKTLSIFRRGDSKSAFNDTCTELIKYAQETDSKEFYVSVCEIINGTKRWF